MKVPTPNPYCSFKNDRERRLALMSQDVRRVVVALIFVAGWNLPVIAALFR